MRFFDEYVHDSRAWFKLIPGNPDNEKGMHVMLADWVTKRKAAQQRGGTRASSANADNGTPYPGRHVAISVGTAGTAVDEEEKNKRDAADEYARTGQIPRFKTSGREPFEAAKETLFLGGRAGYLRFRKIYGGADRILLSSVPGTAVYFFERRAAAQLAKTMATG